VEKFQKVSSKKLFNRRTVWTLLKLGVLPIEGPLDRPMSKCFPNVVKVNVQREGNLSSPGELILFLLKG